MLPAITGIKNSRSSYRNGVYAVVTYVGFIHIHDSFNYDFPSIVLSEDEQFPVEPVQFVVQ